LNPEIAANVIDAGQPGPALMLQIHDAIAAGEMVALLVDRVQPGEPGLPVPFFGRPAPFPLAPWQLATVLGAPVVLAFGLYRGGNRYDLVFESFSEGEQVPRPRRKARIAALIAGYAARLEHHARSAPYNWFNFYDYWPDNAEATRLDATEGAAAGDDAAAGGGLRRRAPARRACHGRGGLDPGAAGAAGPQRDPVRRAARLAPAQGAAAGERRVPPPGRRDPGARGARAVRRDHHHPRRRGRHRARRAVAAQVLAGAGAGTGR